MDLTAAGTNSRGRILRTLEDREPDRVPVDQCGRHVSAAGMVPRARERDVGDSVTFWGSGIDTQYVLPHGTVREVRDELRRTVGSARPWWRIRDYGHSGDASGRCARE